MGVGHYFTVRMDWIYQIQLAADKALEQRLSFNMSAAWPFGFATWQKYINFGLGKEWKEKNLKKFIIHENSWLIIGNSCFFFQHE